MKRRNAVFVALFVLLVLMGLLIPGLQAVFPPTLVRLNTGDVIPSEHGGFSYCCLFGGTCLGGADSRTAPHKPRLSFLENGKPLGPSHARHENIGSI